MGILTVPRERGDKLGLLRVPNAKSDITAMLEKRWGKPTASKSYAGDEELTYKQAGPRIVLKHAPDVDALYLDVTD